MKSFDHSGLSVQDFLLCDPTEYLGEEIEGTVDDFIGLGCYSFKLNKEDIHNKHLIITARIVGIEATTILLEFDPKIYHGHTGHPCTREVPHNSHCWWVTRLSHKRI
jgi:hypothetical protein